jgi:2-polyprenyl-3-methyl-5-hydroxy-6-metoxy-1,4-benzoquinol methylase
MGSTSDRLLWRQYSANLSEGGIECADAGPAGPPPVAHGAPRVEPLHRNRDPVREVPYEVQTLDNPNPIARFAHRSRMRRSMRLIRPYLTQSATLLDYGCGQGRFLSDLVPELVGRDVTLLGYDPCQSAQYEGYRVISDPEDVAADSVDVVTCLEVCEHLSPSEMEEFVEFAIKIMRTNARLLVSVPIMVGPALLLKELSRSVLFRRRTDHSASDLLKAAFLGVPATRTEDIKGSHRGFDWTVTLDRLRASFTVEHTEFSPLPFNHWYGQSQVLVVVAKR